jgi:hypothetical protein
MRSLLLSLMLLASIRLSAQNKELEYFAKVPTRFLKPGLSPMQGIRLGYQGTPVSPWIKNAGALKLDLFRIKFSPRGSVIVSSAAWAGYKSQRHDLYKVIDEKAYERTRYYFVAPVLSAGVSYGFFFPYYLHAQIGILKPWEGAYYEANLPVLYSDQEGVKAMESKVLYSQKGFGETQQYMALELYRPLKSHAWHRHPMGCSVAYTYFPGADSGSRGAWNFGIYWHVKAK